MIITFDKGIHVLAEATNDRKVLARAIGRAQTGGGTSLYDALNLVIRKRLSHISGRKAIVLFTDGVDTTSREATYQSTLRAAEELDAMAYAIQYNTYDDESKPLLNGQNFMRMTTKGETLDVAYKRANFYLRLLANDTGGHFFYADSLKRLNATFARIAEELRQQYSLGYYPKNQSQEGKERRMKVLISRPNVVVRARKSYIYKTQRDASERE
jgi:VWFA-related protein